MKSKIILILLLLLSAGVFFYACTKGSNNSNNNNNNNTGSGNTVSISNFSFISNNLSVAKGTTVTWTNNDSAPHTVTADDNSFTSGTLNKGDTYEHTFNSVGTFNYHCQIHTMMMAAVVVK